MASRRRGRILAFQALYAWDLGFGLTGDASIPDGLLDFSWVKETKPLDEDMAAFSRLLLTGTVENIGVVDDVLSKHLQNWELSRLNNVDRALLRMSVYTLVFQTDMPPSIVIDEAIEISKEFGTDDSYRFVNGVLDAVFGSIRKNLIPGTDKKTAAE